MAQLGSDNLGGDWMIPGCTLFLLHDVLLLCNTGSWMVQKSLYDESLVCTRNIECFILEVDSCLGSIELCIPRWHKSLL